MDAPHRRIAATLAVGMVLIGWLVAGPATAAAAAAPPESASATVARPAAPRLAAITAAAPVRHERAPITWDRVRVVAAPGPTQNLQKVITGVRNLLVGLLVSLATLFLVIAGILYIAAGGDMRAVENAKTALKSAVVGYLIAGVATFIVEALQSVVPK